LSIDEAHFHNSKKRGTIEMDKRSWVWNVWERWAWQETHRER